MQKIIHFPMPTRSEPTPVDWDRIEAQRKQQYPQIPAEAVEITKRIHQIEYGLEEKVEWSLEFNVKPDAAYPPEIIESSLKQTDIIWLLDLLDRFGGEVVCGDKICKVPRPQTRLPVFWLNQVDPLIFQGIEANSEFLCEHYFEAKNYWRILGKNLPDSNLVMIMIRFLDDEARRYIGLIDSATFFLLLDRIGEGTPIEKVLLFDQIG